MSRTLPAADGPVPRRRRLLAAGAAAGALPLLGLAPRSAPAAAALKVLSCEPEWGALVRAIAGDRADVTDATSARQDPHQIQARPSLLARARSADLLICTGAELEVGWLPILQQQSGNPRIQVGQGGYFPVTTEAGVRMLEVPSVLDRSQGDVHAAGNPHVQTDPRIIGQAVQPLAARLAQLDPAGAQQYARNADAFGRRWQQAVDGWAQRGAPLRGVPVVSQHRAFAYLYEWLGIREVGVLEPIPGVEPSLGHLQQLVGTLRGAAPKMVVHAAYQNPQPSQWLSRTLGIADVDLPFTVGGAPGTDDLFGLFDVTLQRLLAGLGAR